MWKPQQMQVKSRCSKHDLWYWNQWEWIKCVSMSKVYRPYDLQVLPLLNTHTFIPTCAKASVSTHSVYVCIFVWQLYHLTTLITFVIIRVFSYLCVCECVLFCLLRQLYLSLSLSRNCYRCILSLVALTEFRFVIVLIGTSKQIKSILWAIYLFYMYICVIDILHICK